MVIIFCINAVCDVKVDRTVVYFHYLSINIACNVNLVEESKQNVCHTESKKARRKLLDTSYETIHNYNAHEIQERAGLFYHVIRVEEMDFSIMSCMRSLQEIQTNETIG